MYMDFHTAEGQEKLKDEIFQKKWNLYLKEKQGLT